MSILSKKKTSTLWILLVQGGSYSYKVELTFTIDQMVKDFLNVFFILRSLHYPDELIFENEQYLGKTTKNVQHKKIRFLSIFNFMSSIKSCC